MKKKLGIDKSLFAAPLITAVILLITYIFKGVYPFGEANITYYDMPHQYVPQYMRNYDILHGSESLIFDWYAGAGTDMTSTFQTYSFNPLNWIFFFLRPEYVVHFMALFLLIKLMLISFNISLYIKKTYRISSLMLIAFSLLYTFSGYVVQYYTNIFFLDSMLLFPLLILALRHMFKNGKELPYTLLLTFQLMNQPYLGFMALLFILFYSLGLFYTLDDKKERREFAARLGLYTFTGIALAAVLMLTAVMKWSTIDRVTGTEPFDLLGVFQTSSGTFREQKVFMAFNTEMAMALAVIVLVYFTVKKKRFSKEFVFRVYVFMIMMFPILNEGILLIWHLGSYKHFPYRNGYMLAFAAIELAAYQWEHIEELPSFNTKGRKSVFILLSIGAAAAAAGGIILLIKQCRTVIDYGINDRGSYSYTNSPMIYLLSFTAFVLLLCLLKKKSREIVMFSIITIHLVTASVCFIAPLQHLTNYNLNYDFADNCIDLRENAGFENDSVSRVKLFYPALSINYPIVLGMPSISQWLNEASSSYIEEIKDLGYGQTSSATYDNGGTLLSDAFLNFKKVISYSDSPLPEQMYSENVSVGDYTVYDMKDTLPFGLLLDERLLDTSEGSHTSPENQLKIAQILSDPGQELFSEEGPQSTVKNSSEDADFDYISSYDLHITSPSAVYVYSSKPCSVDVNGNEIVIPHSKDAYDNTDDVVNNNLILNNMPGNNIHAGNLGLINITLSNIIFAGCFDENEDVNIRINTDKWSSDNRKVLILHLDEMEKICSKYSELSASSYEAGNNRLDITADVNGNNYMFLPFEYLEGWKAEVNGENAEIIPVFNGTFMALKLPDGHCEIHMKYRSLTMMKYSAVSALGAAALLFLIIMKKRGKDVVKSERVGKAADMIFRFVSAAALIVVYILPVFI